MGIIMSRVYDRLFSRDTRILMIGLDAAGKTTLLYKLKLGENVPTIPTIGFNVESVEYRNLHMTIWDVGGQDRIRSLWKHYYHGTDALIFVVDSNDHERLAEARNELNAFLSDSNMVDALVLVFANKMDLPGALSGSAVAEAMSLNSRRETWYIQPLSAVTSIGVTEGLEWLSQQVKLRFAKPRAGS